MRMVLDNNIEFQVKTIMDIAGDLEIEFADGTTYEQVAKIYDKTMGEKMYSENALRRFELYSDEGELQGVHFGYTITKNISALGGVVKTTIGKEDELKTEVEKLKVDLAECQALIRELQAK